MYIVEAKAEFNWEHPFNEIKQCRSSEAYIVDTMEEAEKTKEGIIDGVRVRINLSSTVVDNVMELKQIDDNKYQIYIDEILYSEIALTITGAA